MMYTLILVEAQTIEGLLLLMDGLANEVRRQARLQALDTHTQRFPVNQVIQHEYGKRFIRMKVIESEPG